MEETHIWYAESLQDLKDRQRQLAIEWDKFILEKVEADKAQEEAA